MRPTLLALMLRVRVLIHDPLDAPTVFTQDDIQDALDVWRTERRWVPLRPMPTFGPGGAITYLDYYHDAQNWEADVVLQDLSYATLTPAVSELFVGHWQFTTQPSGIGVRATGKTYDLYASAADLLDAWATRIKLTAYSSKTGVNARNLGQQVANFTALAQRYRQLALPQSGRIFQGDAAPDNDGGGVTYPSIGLTR